MKILIVCGDDALLSSLTDELECRGFEVLTTHFGDGGLHLYKKHGPWEFVLTDYRFFPGTQIRDCMHLVTAIDAINAFQEMAIMTAHPKETRENLRHSLRQFPVLRKPFVMGQLLRLLRQPVLPF
jgi:DNA-binding NtrC family response regulator